MKNKKKQTTYTASDARKNLYSILKDAATGLSTYEILLQGSDPVVLISKNELESWQETLDILSNSEERQAIAQAKNDKKTYTHQQLLQELGLKQESGIEEG